MSTPLLPPISRVIFLAAVASAVALSGCDTSPPKNKTARTIDQKDIVTAKVYPALEGTIGQFAFFADAMPMPVEGWAIVAGLPGTGSGEMSPEVRQYLTEQLYRNNAGSYAKGTEEFNPERILASNQIAAVEVHGVIPPLARRGDTFDLAVKALPDTQTTSLRDGLLWTAPLKLIGLRTDIDTRPIALGRGPIYIPKLENVDTSATTQPVAEVRALRQGRVLGGGVVSESREVRLQLRSPSMRFAGAIQRAINSRFPGRDKCADAMSDTVINLTIPPEYLNSPRQFIDLVLHMYLAQDVPGFKEAQAAKLVKALEDPKAPDKELSLALEGLGRSILPDYIEPLYASPNPRVRFWGARAGAALKDVGGLVVLEETAKDLNNPLHKEAVQAIIDASHDGDTVRATLALSELLKSPNTTDRIIGYGALVAIRSREVRTYTISKKFLLDIVPCDGPPLIYATQSDTPRIALIGTGFTLPPGALYVSADNLLTVSVLDEPAAQSGGGNPASNVVTASSVGADSSTGETTAASRPNRKAVTLFWRSPMGDKTVNLKTSANLADVIARVAWAPDPLAVDYDPHAEYIGASYERVTEMLAGMCADQSLSARFVIEKAPAMTTSSADAIAGRPEGSTEPQLPSPTVPLNGPTTAPAAVPH
ncbi:MAG TPA: flagellar basal body P-ring protein FlgI [Phycisphaerae bacterium]|nr:flagellar basal body P-ring protein FlgI [Phycisphaerae bacterium]